MTEEGQTIDEELSEIDQLRKQWDDKESHYKKIIGDQGNQIGVLNKVASQVIDQDLTPSQPVDDWDFDPALKEVNELKGVVNQMKQEEALRKLEGRFPGFRDLPKDEKFMEWVQDSPVRSNLMARADGMDLGAATEMLSLWEERQKLAEELQVQGTSNRKRALNDASMEKGSAGGGTRKNYYTHHELQELRQNPDEWAAKWPDILKAYSEGRVR